MARFDRMTPQGPAGFAGNIAPATMRTGGGQAPQVVAPGPHPIVSNPALGGVPFSSPGLPPTRQPVPLGHVGPPNAVGMGAQPGGYGGAYGVPPWFASLYGRRF